MNNDFRQILPLLQQFGINPGQLGPDKIEKLIEIAQKIGNTNDISQDISKQIIDIFGVNTKEKQEPTTRRTKMKRNEICNCGSNKKFKKCCGN